MWKAISRGASTDLLATMDLLHANAWCGAEACGELDSPAARAWGARRGPPGAGPQTLLGLSPRPLNLSDWTDPRVGWGLVVPDRDDVPAADKALGKDLSAPLQELIRVRNNAPVLRWREGLDGRLRRYRTDGGQSDLNFRGQRGMGPNAIPRYLLIAASPEAIPWRAQYRLQAEAYVGRLHLDEAGEARYIEALLKNWSGGAALDVDQPVVWAVDHGHPDITRLMRKTLAEPLATEFGVAALVDENSTGTALLNALQQRRPAFVATSSHGATFPLNDAAALRANLGLPVDGNRATIDLAKFAAWAASGAIWYAHACCSAGTDGQSTFAGIFAPQSNLASTLKAIATVGSVQAPLPAALLGGASPARAFIGHVEPTFDWTLRDPVTGQVNVQSLLDTFYTELHTPGMPVGRALDLHYRAVAGLLLDHADAVQAINEQRSGAEDRALRAKLVAMDRLAMVLLGDPTVTLGRSG